MAKPLSRRATVIITLAIVLVPVTVLIVASAMGGGGFFERYPNLHYMIAFGIGATLTALLSVGLFSLMFMSARGGHDDEANVKQENEADTDVNTPKDGG